MKKPRPLPNPSAKRRRAGSKRRAAGWMLLILGVPVAAVWVASRWYTWHIAYLTPKKDRTITLTSGFGFYFHYPADWTESHFRLTVNSERQGWGWWAWRYDRSGQRGEFVDAGIPLWPIPLLLWTTGGLALWSGRRARRRALEGHCPTCGYNLAGLNADAGVCPECGRKAAATT